MCEQRQLTVLSPLARRAALPGTPAALRQRLHRLVTQADTPTLRLLLQTIRVCERLRDEEDTG